MWAAAVAVFIIGVAVFVWMSSKAPDPGGNTLATDSFNNALATNSPPANANAKAVPLSAAPTASDDGDAAKQKADGPWKHTLQALASTNEFEARSFAARLTNAAIPAYVVSKDIGGTVWYRVRIGRFATVEEARRYAGEVRDRARAAGIALMPLQTTAYEHPQEK